MIVYIAAASREVERVRAAQRALAEAGHTLAYDWLTPIEANTARGLRDSDLDRAERADHAWRDLTAIARADALWLLAPAAHVSSTGCWVELGFGGDEWYEAGRPQLFCAVAQFEVASDAEGLAALGKISGWKTVAPL